MTDNSTTQRWLFPEVFSKPVEVQFDQAESSSDGGAVLLKAAEQPYRTLLSGMAACIPDGRQAAKVQHQFREMLAQRVYGIACGYEDANDAARLRQDPMHKLLAGRDPVKGQELASQSGLSRFENTPGPRELYRMGELLAEQVLARQARLRHGQARQVTIDLDPTEDPTHGAQQLSFFNGHYDGWCYLPVLAFVSFDGEREQYLAAAVLRPGNAPAAAGARGILRRLLAGVRRHFGRVRVLVRLDGGFAHPGLLDWLERQPHLDYVTGLPKNAVLERQAEPAMQVARRLARQSGETEHVYTETQYAAGTWKHPRRVIVKAEVVCPDDKDPRDNPRFLVTNLRQSPQWIYERVYCARGEVENRIKELHWGVEIGRTSCSSFWANQLRVLLSAVAYVLLQELRRQAEGTVLARAQVTTLRNRLLKISVRITRSVRRIVLHLPRSFPDRDTFDLLAQALGATAG